MRASHSADHLFVKDKPLAEAAGLFDRKFWMTHVALPLIVAVIVLTVLETTGIDLWVADRWYASEGFDWVLRSHWLTYDVIHHYGKVMIITLGLILLVLLVTSFRSPRLRSWRAPLGYLLTCMVLLPVLITWCKHFSHAPCPWDMVRYRGDIPYQHNFSYGWGASGTGHCFPAGHASGGFALVALYFAVYGYVRRPARFLLPGIAVGSVFALGQEARGAHFLSHDLWTVTICWFGALGLYLLFRPANWERPIAATGRIEAAR
jgi:membrane-associated PAP2 superfamily phosphatase